MSDERVALGPGDDDPRSPASVGADAVRPLGPGDDDPKSPARGVAGPADPPLAPGAGASVDDDFAFLAPPPPGPGESVRGPRQLVRIPKARPRAAQE